MSYVQICANMARRDCTNNCETVRQAFQKTLKPWFTHANLIMSINKYVINRTCLNLCTYIVPQPGIWYLSKIRALVLVWTGCQLFLHFSIKSLLIFTSIFICTWQQIKQDCGYQKHTINTLNPASKELLNFLKLVPKLWSSKKKSI